MRIAETARIPLPQPMQRTSVSNSTQVSDVSREERMQLLTEKMRSRTAGAAADTYSERAQLLSGVGSTRNSWIA